VLNEQQHSQVIEIVAPIYMKIRLLNIFFFVATYTFFACKKEDVPILTGDIKGYVSLIDCYGFPSQDKSGIQVQLSNETILMEALTDAEGHYSFEDLPFGNYRIHLVKENYIERNSDFQFLHIGGDVPTLTHQIMNQIPEYWFGIDSLSYNGSSKLNIYLQAYEVNKPFATNISPPITYLHCFFSQSPNVSAENYENSFIETPTNYSPDNLYKIYWVWYGGWYNFLNNYTGTIYCRVYPQTFYDEMWFPNNSDPHTVRPETLGKPSEVFAFILDEITRDF
jgi:hypothetical protein